MFLCDLLRGAFQERGQTATFVHDNSQKWFYLDQQRCSEPTVNKIWDSQAGTGQCECSHANVECDLCRADAVQSAYMPHSIIQTRRQTRCRKSALKSGVWSFTAQARNQVTLPPSHDRFRWTVARCQERKACTYSVIVFAARSNWGPEAEPGSGRGGGRTETPNPTHKPPGARQRDRCGGDDDGLQGHHTGIVGSERSGPRKARALGRAKRQQKDKGAR
jgi:hypothetical protein